MDIVVTQIKAHRTAYEALEGLIAAYKANPVSGRTDFNDSHGDRIENVEEHAFIQFCHEGQVIEIDASHRVIVSGLLRILKTDLNALFIPLQDRLQRYGFQVEESLELRAADGLQETDLIFRFHTLADGIHAQGGRHLHQLGQDNPAAVPLFQLPHEAHIKLDQVKAYALQNIQRGIAASEVIHPDGKAQAPEALNLQPDEFKVTADNAFRNFNRQPVMTDSESIRSFAYLFHHVTGIKIRPRKIDGLRHDMEPGLFESANLLQHLIKHEQIDFIDESLIFKCRYEVGGRQKAFFRIDPSGQRLFVAHLSADCPDDRLIVDLYPFLGDGPVNM